MSFYLIRNKHTKEWISALNDLGQMMSRGFTHAHLSNTEMPRLFYTRTAAKIALQIWLRGRLVAKKERFVGCDFYKEGEDVTLVLTPVPSRCAADMEIVPCKVVVMEVGKSLRGNSENAETSVRIP